MARLPLEGIRILEASDALALPFATHILADFGAEVILVEHCGRPNMFRMRAPFPANQPGEAFWNRGGSFNQWNRNKFSLTLDLTHPLGKQTFKALARISDVVAENFAAGVMDRLGLGYEALRREKPDLIYLSNTGYGRTGPWAGFVGMAQVVEAAVTAHLTGYPDRGPSRAGQSVMDIIAAWNMASAVLLALFYRRLTGRGQHIDHSLLEPAVHLVAVDILEWQMTGRERVRQGNAHPFWAPHGCYPCKGQDQWVVIAVTSDVAWRGLCRAMGSPQWSSDPRFADTLGRWRHRAELDNRIASWTRGLEKWDVVERLQGEGVACGAVLTTRDLLRAPHLRQRGFFVRLEHPPETGIGARLYPGRAFRLSATPGQVRRAAPPLGYDNEAILGGLLGLSSLEIQELERQRVIGKEAWRVEGEGEGRTYTPLKPPAAPDMPFFRRSAIQALDPDYLSVSQ